MEEELLRTFFFVKVRGKNEYELYKNYVTDLTRKKMVLFFHLFFNDQLKVKDDAKSLYWRKRGNEAYCKKINWERSIELYTKSLRYATYNSEPYALALANRSAVLCTIGDYQSCLKDIALCLKAKHPNNMKPKMYFRKAECLQKLGEAVLMRETLAELLAFIDDAATLPSSDAENYKGKIANMLATPGHAKSDPPECFNEVPVLEPNPSFHNASPSLLLKYNKRDGFHVYAKKEIAVGEVVLVDKAYAFAPSYLDGKTNAKIYCQNCAVKSISCVPCKVCVKYIYCSEECRDSAWNRFHQWECIGIQAGFLPRMWDGHFALRVILQATNQGLSALPIKFKEGITKYGSKEDYYPYIYNLPHPFNKLSEDKQLHYAANAAAVVTYLKLKTNYFAHLKKWPAYANNTDKEVMNKVGGLIIRHLAQFHWNGVIIKDFDKQETKEVDLFLTVCPSMALMNHSCDPNTAHYFVGDTVVVKAVRNIEPNEELCYPYMNTTYRHVGTTQRRTMLKKMLYITCTCTACTNPKMDMDKFNAYLCIKCNGAAVSEIAWPLPRKECVCLDCNYKFLLPQEIYVQKRLSIRLLADFTDGGHIDKAHQSLVISKSIYRPTHKIFRVIYQELLNYHKRTRDLKRLMEIEQMLNSHIEEIYGEAAIQNGLFYYNSCKEILNILEHVALHVDLQVLQEALNEFMKIVDKAKFIFNLHYPPFIRRFQEMEKRLFQFRILHVIRIANSVPTSSNTYW